MLTGVLPTDPQSRADQLAWTAYYTAGLTDPGGPADLAAEGLAGPDALERWLTGVLVRGQETGEVPAGVDPRIETVSLLALANGLTSSVLGGQRDVADAVAVVRYRLDRLFGAG